MTGTLAGSTATGTFRLIGTLAVENNGIGGCTSSGGCIRWLSFGAQPNQATISSQNLSGSFAGDSGQNVAINPLSDSSTAQPLGTSFSNYNFVDLSFEPSLPNLLANSIPLGTAPATDCSTNVGTAAAGQTCALTPTTTPADPGGSPFTFANTNNLSSVCCNSSAIFNISGITSDGTGTWSAVFESDFQGPGGNPAAGSFQDVLSSPAANGEWSSTFFADFTVQDPLTPEPSTFWTWSAGALLLSGIAWRRRKAMA